MTDLAEPDRITGAPHPRETQVLFGQDAAIADFLTAWNTGRLHSGWMLTGPRGVGKATLAWKIARFLLSQRQTDAGGLFGDPPPVTALDVAPDNPDARLIDAGSHPGLFVLRRVPNKDGTALQQDITVAALRGHDDGDNRLKQFLQMSGTDGGQRVVIIDAADEMNVTVANSILKLLEEPPARTTFMLIAHQPSRLLPTIRSRCRVLRCKPLSPQDLGAALLQAGHDTAASEALATLSAGSAGDALRLLTQDGLQTYAQIIGLLTSLPQMDRTAAIKLAEGCTGRANEARFALTLDLVDRFLGRAARAGLMGEPVTQGAPGEARLLARLSPHDAAARAWADVQQTATARARHGRAVNLDPAALILDMLFSIERTAQATVAR
ncbi:DNA polymerase-3 subunit delta' [Loktanella fryxellensis]|uniref:DNA polymerase-3 subunit delta n=1 Tax=Loktanella fryxellensis TaxID=245187 RepID=A0A1H8GEP3_9RHOB|nr:DNA polymerase III subunit delta' [Loktanella fryxellensis]SEN41947.1 DNA polymerase-3 subunit delta' [Loktanella fryxellensis]